MRIKQGSLKVGLIFDAENVSLYYLPRFLCGSVNILESNKNP